MFLRPLTTVILVLALLAVATPAVASAQGFGYPPGSTYNPDVPPGAPGSGANPYFWLIEGGLFGASYDISGSSLRQDSYGFFLSFGVGMSGVMRYMPSIEFGTFPDDSFSYHLLDLWAGSVQFEFGESNPPGGGVGFGFFLMARTGFAFLIDHLSGDTWHYFPLEVGVGIRLYFGSFTISPRVYAGHHIGVGSSLTGSPKPNNLSRAGGELAVGIRF
ncbi:MAG: hypothetical protein AB7K09_18495 [Planctomycetota bacterium]